MLKKLVATVKRVKRKHKASKDQDVPPNTVPPAVPLVHKFTLSNIDEPIGAGPQVDAVKSRSKDGDANDTSSPCTPSKRNEKARLPFAADSVCGGRFQNEDAFCVVPNFIVFPLHSIVCPPSCPFLQQQQQEEQSHHPPDPSASAAAVHASAVPETTAAATPTQSYPAHPNLAASPSSSKTPQPGTKEPGDTELLHFFGVYDGHGGGAAAEHCADQLHRRLREDVLPFILQAKGAGGDPAPEGGPGTRAARPSAPGSAVGSEPAGHMHDSAEGGAVGAAGCAIEAAFASAFIKTHKEFVAASKSTYIGTTAVVTLVGDANIWVANCGDSRAVLCRGGHAIALSSDHKPTRDDEAARVKAAGGHVLWDRVMGELAVSRAIGDEFLRPYVIADPEVVHMLRTEDDELLLLATDGLWDVFTNQEACDVALKQLHKGWAEGGAHCRQAASHLIREALMRSTRDNVTVVVVDLKMLKSFIDGGLPGVGGCAC